jgi:hypothetical protein
VSGELLSGGHVVHYHYDDLPPIPTSGGQFEKGAVARCSCGKRFVSEVRRRQFYGGETAHWRPMGFMDMWRKSA